MEKTNTGSSPTNEVTQEGAKQFALGEELVNNLVEETKQEGEGEAFKESHEIIRVEKFDDMGLKDDLLRGIYGYGFKAPSEIQMKAVLPVIQGKDVIAQAQSGTGKTGAFATGLLSVIDANANNLQSLVVAPTRELAVQIAFVINALGEYLGVKVHACVGGSSMKESIQHIKNGVHVVVGTPGRVFDFLKRGILKTDYLKLFVMDEADEMLEIGFADQVKQIFKYLPQDVQIALFSATLPPKALELTQHFMNDPVRILVDKTELTLEGIRQFYVAVEQESWKNDILHQLYATMDINQCIIFCNTKKRVEELAAFMTENEHTVNTMMSDMDQTKRDIVMQQFRKGAVRVLITTDILARGIDVQQVELVINFELPQRKENYIHRIGRAGRFGRKGTAINFVCPQDAKFIKELQEHYNTQINELPTDLDDL